MYTGRRPGTVGTGRHACDMDAAGVKVDEEQDVVGYRPAERPDSLGEEVRCPERFEVPLDELMPGATAAFWAGIETMLEQDPSNRRSGDVMEKQLAEFTEDSSVAPTRGLRHFDDQLTELFRLPWPAPLAAFDAESVFAHPASKGPGMDDGDDVLELGAEPRAELDEFGLFGWSDFEPPWQLAAKNPVLGLEVLDYFIWTSSFSVARAKSSRRGCRNRFISVECVSRW
jgi:hypothetical protein